MDVSELISLRKILRKLFLVFLIPILVVLSYFLLDPFKVLRHYDDYAYSPVVLNRDFVSTEYYLNNREKYGYNAFILGHSKTLGFRVQDWQKYISADNSPYHFDASAETLFGILRKIELIDKNGDSLKSALILLDEGIMYMTTEEGDGHIFNKHPAISDRSALTFHLAFFKVYFQKIFFIKYIDYLITGKYKSYMKGFLEPRKVLYTQKTNDLILEDIEFMAANNPDSFYNAQASVFYPRDTTREDTCLDMVQKNQIISIVKIREIFKKHNTDAVIVIPPNYNLTRIHPNLLHLFQIAFGKENVYDYSGRNELSYNIRNFYETAHFRPLVGDSIMKTIYKDRNLRPR